MIDPQILEKAVAQKIITREQMEALLRLAAERDGPSSEDERFRLISGFNDVFLALGVLLLAGGIGGVFQVWGLETWGAFASAAGMWLLSELFAARLRLTLPSITAATAFAFFIASGVSALTVGEWVSFSLGLENPEEANPNDRYLALAVPLSTLGAMLVYYARFRLPYSLFLIAFSTYFSVLAGIYLVWPDLRGSYGLTSITLMVGILIFLAAMAYDLSDRERMTRRSDSAFWLHLAAAPLIVHSVMMMAFEAIRDNAGESSGILIVFPVFLFLTLVALIVDRRAVLVAALSYLGFAFAFVFNEIGTDAGSAFLYTIVTLGLSVIVLGVGWRPLRRIVMAPLPSALKRRLPVLH